MSAACVLWYVHGGVAGPGPRMPPPPAPPPPPGFGRYCFHVCWRQRRLGNIWSVGKRNKKRKDEAARELQAKQTRRSDSSSSSKGELFKDL